MKRRTILKSGFAPLPHAEVAYSGGFFMATMVRFSGCGHGGMWSHYGSRSYGPGYEARQNHAYGNRVHPNPAYVSPVQSNGPYGATYTGPVQHNTLATGSRREIHTQ